MTRFLPADLAAFRDAGAAARAAEKPVEIIGGGSKRALGRPLQTPHLLDLSRLSGIRDYAPSELVLTAGAATPLADIERALAECGQMLAFEPPDWRALLGGEGEPTLGGALACNLSGPRRIRGGARPFSRVPGCQRARRNLQGRRQGRQERHRLRSVQADGRVLRHPRRA